MHETSADLAALQDLLDRSAAAAGARLRRIIFGSAPDSVRFGHIRRHPQVSATHLPEKSWLSPCMAGPR
jgi:hypothetical protein